MCTQAGSDGLRSSLSMHMLPGKQNSLQGSGEVVLLKVNDDRCRREIVTLKLTVYLKL